MFAAINAFLTRAISGYFLNKSLRFRSSASAYLNRTASASISTFTVSMWLKRGTLTSNFQYFFSYNNSGNTDGYGLAFNQTTDTLYYYNGTAQATTAAYRDPAAWYHIVFSNNAGAFTLYVNGVSVKTGTATAIPSSSVMNLGRYGFSSTFYFDGELAEINFVDGQALTPTSFGAFSTYNQWLPIKYAGTYGNGFYLPFNATSATSYAGSFNGSSQYLSVAKNAAFEPSAAQPWTVEAWVYITSFASENEIFAYTSPSVTLGADIGTYMKVNVTAGTLTGGMYNGANQFTVTSSAALPLRAWVHCATVSSGSAITVYVNGLSVGSTTTALAPNAPASAAFKIGYFDNIDPRYLSGQISNFRFVKGTAVYTANFIPPTAPLTAITNTSLLTLQNATIVDNSTNAFTITNVGTVVTSVQSPFLVSTVLTADSSGNANNWTPNNISLTAGSTYDSLTDAPTLTSATVANYAVLNPLDKGTTVTLSNGNLTYATTTEATFRATVQIPTTGKYYWEVTIISGTPMLAGIATASAGLTLYLGNDASGWGYYSSNGIVYNNNATLATYSTATTGDVIGFAFSSDAQTFAIYKNNTIMGTLTGFTQSGKYFPAGGSLNSGGNFNFGQQPFTYTPPSGFLPLNTFNI